MPATCPADVDDDLADPAFMRGARGAATARGGRRGSLGRVMFALVAALAIASAGSLAAPADESAAAVLKKGSRGAAVVRLQKKLRISADGVFGPQTRRAVRRYQRSKGLTVDGVVGPQTAGSLGIRLPTARSQSVRRGGKGGSRVRLPAILHAIAQCESGGDPRAVSPSGAYRGKYQFDRQTWAAYGRAGDPARASEAEQDRRALKLYRARGTAPWPNCP